ncbi:MAG: NAD-dependent epimerase/dehydratase family protein [Bdellovibrio sp.]
MENQVKTWDTLSLDAPITIVIAGASGYIGKELIASLLEKFPKAQITALSRSAQPSDDPRVQWKPCDLFSLKSLEAALPPQIDFAYYLVHSMSPTAQLDQGSFADYDLLLADNFCRALKRSGLRQLVYLGGLIPEGVQLSLHLQSRLEIEETFTEHKIPTTVLRAGLILGESGSSSQILIKLVQRLPVMICPHWTQTMTTPVDLQTVLVGLLSVLNSREHTNKVFDLAGCEPLTYADMMRQTARRMGLRRWFIPVPFFTPTLSRLWVSLITNSPKSLVYPLVESLEHPMLARAAHLLNRTESNRTYMMLLEKASLKPKSRRSIYQFRAKRKTVRSVQRLPLDCDKDAQWIKDHYSSWLPRFLKPFILVRQKGDTTQFYFWGLRVCLLELRLSTERSNPDRQLLYITRGLLVAKNNSGRLEFRVVLGRRYVIAAIHDFTPALPWFIYKYTQAKLHLLVMNSFRKNLELRMRPK